MDRRVTTIFLLIASLTTRSRSMTFAYLFFYETQSHGSAVVLFVVPLPPQRLEERERERE